MTIEQYKQLKENQRVKRQDAFRLYKKAKEHVEKIAKEKNDPEMLKTIRDWKLEDKSLPLPHVSFTYKIRDAFEELILNDVAATEGSLNNADSLENVQELIAEIYEVNGAKPTSYCYLTSQDIPDLERGSFFLGWEGDVDLITAILEKNGLKVTFKDEKTKLLIEEK